MIPERTIIKTRAVCVFCGMERQCAHFPIEDGQPDNGLGPWCCKFCWEREMAERRAWNRQQPAGSPDRFIVMPWPEYAKKPLRKKTRGNTVIITSRDLIRVLFGGAS